LLSELYQHLDAIIIARESAIIYFAFEFNVLVQVFVRILLHYMLVRAK
jgi:hypothetical protein